LLRPNDRVLISYEVGHPSTALLHLLRTGLDLSTPKKLRFIPVIVFLEDQYHLCLEERCKMIAQVRKEVESQKFDMHFASFKDCVINDNICISDNSLNLNENDKEQLNQVFPKGTNKTKKKEIMSILKRNTLISTAKQLSCKYIFTPELSIDIASNLLTNISLGRGSQVPVDTGFCDDRDDQVKILRPLRSFDIKEVGFYNILHSLEPVSIRQPDINQYSSVQDLMKKFVSDLQENYPATVTTIVKTGDKLALDQNKLSVKCKLCKCVILEKNEELNSEESTSFSKLVSNQLPDHSMSGQERYCQIESKFNNTAQVFREYCFSCYKISGYLLLPDT